MITRLRWDYGLAVVRPKFDAKLYGRAVAAHEYLETKKPKLKK